MIIYFVCSEFKGKRISDIKLAEHQQTIEYGDIIIRETRSSLSFYLVKSNSSLWNECTQFDDITIDTPFLSHNCLLLWYDNINHRKGDTSILQKILKLKIASNTFNLISESIQILQHQRDRWELSTIISISNPNVGKTLELNDPCSGYTYKPSVVNCKKFPVYFNEKLRMKFENLLLERLPLKEIYFQLRKDNPKEFRNAIINFSKENPEGNIYDIDI